MDNLSKCLRLVQACKSVHKLAAFYNHYSHSQDTTFGLQLELKGPEAISWVGGLRSCLPEGCKAGFAAMLLGNIQLLNTWIETADRWVDSVSDFCKENEKTFAELHTDPVEIPPMWGTSYMDTLYRWSDNLIYEIRATIVPHLNLIRNPKVKANEYPIDASIPHEIFFELCHELIAQFPIFDDQRVAQGIRQEFLRLGIGTNIIDYGRTSRRSKDWISTGPLPEGWCKEPVVAENVKDAAKYAGFKHPSTLRSACRKEKPSIIVMQAGTSYNLHFSTEAKREYSQKVKSGA